MPSLSEQFLHRIRDAHKRRRMSWWERIYLPAIAQGLWITSVHFWRNLFLHIAHRVGLFVHMPASVTIQYPDQQRQMAERLRTRHRLTRREDGTPRCVACMMCETVCPARCIYITPAEHPQRNTTIDDTPSLPGGWLARRGPGTIAEGALEQEATVNWRFVVPVSKH